MRRIVLSIGVFWLLVYAGSVLAYPGGAPICHADDIVGSPMGNPIPMGYALVASPGGYTPGQPVSISIVHADPGMRVRGVLLYVEDPDALDGDLRPIKRGNFVAPYPVGIKAVFNGYPGCDFAGQTPVLTHDTASEKSLPLSLSWSSPVIDVGALRIRAIALLSFNTYQLLELDLQLDPVFHDSFE